MNFPAFSAVEIYHNTKAKVYPNGQQKITVCSKPIFKNECFESVEFHEPISKPKKMDNEVRPDNIRRAKGKVFDLAMCNQFTHFVTWTLDKEKIDRYNPEEVSKKLKTFLKNKVSRNDLKYVVIPEHHKDGAIHMHGLISGNFNFVDSGKVTEKGVKIYNMPQWDFGYSTAIPLDGNVQKVANYITKYVTKEFKKIFGSFYYSGGHGLVREPKINYYDTDYDLLDLQEFSPKAVNLWFKYINTDGVLE